MSDFPPLPPPPPIPAPPNSGLPFPPVATGRKGSGRRGRKPLSKRQRIYFLIFYVLVLGVGLIAGIAGVRSSLRTRSLERPVPGGVATTGSVIAMNKIRARGYVYAPVVQFTDASGKTYQFIAPTSSDEPGVGSSALVSYDPGSPNHAHDLSDSSEAWEAPFYACMGIAL